MGLKGIADKTGMTLRTLRTWIARGWVSEVPTVTQVRAAQARYGTSSAGGRPPTQQLHIVDRMRGGAALIRWGQPRAPGRPPVSGLERGRWVLGAEAEYVRPALVRQLVDRGWVRVNKAGSAAVLTAQGKAVASS